MKKSAFTLSEVLITLGIIGVVVAITMPVLINRYQERVTVTKVKKFYSMINQAFLLSVKDNGYANEWNVGDGRNATTANQFASYIKPYLKIVRDCGTSSGCLAYKESPKMLNNTSTFYNYDTNSNYYKMVLADGSYIFLRGAIDKYCQTNDVGISNTCGFVAFDINGGKEPNTVGKDIFVVYITPFTVKTSPQTCDKTSEGWSCLAYILKNNNMNYLYK